MAGAIFAAPSTLMFELSSFSLSFSLSFFLSFFPLFISGLTWSVINSQPFVGNEMKSSKKVHRSRLRRVRSFSVSGNRKELWKTNSAYPPVVQYWSIATTFGFVLFSLIRKSSIPFVPESPRLRLSCLICHFLANRAILRSLVETVLECSQNWISLCIVQRVPRLYLYICRVQFVRARCHRVFLFSLLCLLKLIRLTREKKIDSPSTLVDFI